MPAEVTAIVNDEATALRLAETLGGSFTRSDADYLAWLEGIVHRLGADVLIREPTPSESAERRPW